MSVIDLTEEHEKTYMMCLEDWSEEMKEAGNHKCEWYEKMKDKGLGVKVALEDDGVVSGMIQYEPIEYSTAEGEDLYFIDCIWVHGYEAGIGNHQKKGIGKALLLAAEKDVVARGAKGIAAWGLGVPMWMKASWYKKQGYKKVQRSGIQVLLWKPFDEMATPPTWVKVVKEPIANSHPGKVTVTAFYNGRCQSPNITVERARRAVDTFGERVVFVEINTFDRDVFREWGISDALYIEDENISSGPPATYDKIVKAINKKVIRLNNSKRA
ncbi:MAG: GNAT family N-acetyltransferase [Vallitaleaceae bacterium]|jgi:GNAT superfamily N-acetyltransferase|nr:GNAT family N-acetyltransferase [Vallitaleaceae bacterium]